MMMVGAASARDVAEPCAGGISLSRQALTATLSPAVRFRAPADSHTSTAHLAFEKTSRRSRQFVCCCLFKTNPAKMASEFFFKDIW